MCKETEFASKFETLYEKIYPLFGLGLGAHLVEANIVLTLVGARGYTEFFVRQPEVDVRQNIFRINDLINCFGIRLEFVKAFKFTCAGSKSINLSKVAIESLEGYEAVSREIVSENIFFGLKIFTSKMGWEGKDKWLGDLKTAIRDAQTDRRICGSYDPSEILMGLRMGYPLVAIFDFEEYGCRISAPSMFSGCPYGKFLEKRHGCRLLCADIPEASLYIGDSPAFFFSGRHGNDPSIERKVALWRKILNEFYESAWHRQIGRDRGFIETRREIERWRKGLAD